MKRGRNQRRRQGGANPNRALDSNGPDVRIRGTAMQIYDKYQALARDASSAGDRVKAENYLQHAEHYFRLIKSMQPAAQPTQNYDQGEIEAPANADDKQTANGADGDEAEEASVKGEVAGDEPVKAEDAQPAPPEEKKPRRRRTKRAPKKEEAAASDKAEEAVAS